MSSKLRVTCAAALIAAMVAGVASSAATAAEPEWIRQFGTNEFETSGGVGTGPDGRVHAVGTTTGSFAGASKGDYDAYVITFDRHGTELWRRQPGTAGQDEAKGVATDTDGNVYVVGSTAGALGGASKGAYDGFVIKFDRDGRILWKRQPGTDTNEYASAVATDADGNVYVVGMTEGALGGANKGLFDAFVIKFDRDGRTVWKRQPGTTDHERATGVATDADGNVYVVGTTAGGLGGANKGFSDPFVIKFDRDGRPLWKRQRGTPKADIATGVATDADGNVYVVGETRGSLSGAFQGSYDAFVIKYDRDGRTLWTDQPGTTGWDGASGVATDGDGNVVVVGSAFGALAGAANGSGDPFVIKYDRDGRMLWSDQPGTTADEAAVGIAIDPDGNVAVVGDTDGALPGNTSGGSIDSFLIQYGPDGPQ